MTNTDELKRLAEGGQLRIASNGDLYIEKHDGFFTEKTRVGSVLSLIEEVEGLREIVKADQQVQDGTAVRSTTVDSQMLEVEHLRAELDKALEVIGPFAELVDEVAIEREFQPGLVLALRDASAFTERHKSQGESDD